MTRPAGLIGHPIAHSRSPAMHNAAFAALGIEAHYDLWTAPTTQDLARWVARVRAPDALGANVTIPHKLTALELVDRLAPSATAVGAVNTLVPRGEKLEGHNTDALGLVRALQAAGHGHAAVALVLGAGGAARAALEAARRMGAERGYLASRSPAAARTLADVSPLPLTLVDLATPPVDLAWSTILGQVDLLLNTTPIGSPEQPGLPLAAELLARLPAHAVVVDLIVAETALVRAARAHGLAAQAGAPMLLHQGALALELWVEQPAPLAVMWAALSRD